jgi:hypothetical protein
MRMTKYSVLILACVFSVFLSNSLLSMSRPVTMQPESDTKENMSILGGWFPEDLEEDEKAEWNKGQPPGWSRGKKTGWRGGDMPPGLAKKQGVGVTEYEYPQDWGKWKTEQKETWKERLENIRERIRKNTGRNDTETMLYSAEAAARRGVPLEQLESVTERFMQRKLTAEEYEKTTRAMAYGVGRNVDFRRLGNSVNSNIDRGVRGNNLAINVYKEIAASEKR